MIIQVYQNKIMYELSENKFFFEEIEKNIKNLIFLLLENYNEIKKNENILDKLKNTYPIYLNVSKDIYNDPNFENIKREAILLFLNRIIYRNDTHQILKDFIENKKEEIKIYLEKLIIINSY